MNRPSMNARACLAFALFTAVSSLAGAASSSGALVEEVMTQSSDPRAHDWRRPRFGLDLGYGAVHEENSFKTRSFSLGAFTSVSRGWIARGAVRMTTVEATGSSRSLAKTPFSQAGQPSRTELMAGAGYALLEGRSATPASPSITDLDHALYAIGGAQYNLFKSKDAEPISAMQAVYYDFAAEAGLRFEAYLPRSLGLALEWTYAVPLTGANPDLPGWQRFGGYLVWSFGR